MNLQNNKTIKSLAHRELCTTSQKCFVNSYPFSKRLLFVVQKESETTLSPGTIEVVLSSSEFPHLSSARIFILFSL